MIRKLTNAVGEFTIISIGLSFLLSRLLITQQEKMAIVKLTSATFDQFLKEQDPFEKPMPIFDLSGITMISPAGLVQLASSCYGLAESQRQPQIIVTDLNVRTYLIRAGFCSTVETVATIFPTVSISESRRYENRQGSNPMLIEVTRIENGSQLPEILNHIVWVLRNKLKYLKNDAFDVAVAISEICQNTFDHNHAKQGFLAMQVYGKGTKRFLEVAVSDCGDGFAKTLLRNPNLKPVRSDFEAIKLATSLGISEYEDQTRGTGLYHMLEIAYKHQGSVQIWSGTSKITFRMKEKQSWAKNVPNCSGVHVAFSLPARIRS